MKLAFSGQGRYTDFSQGYSLYRKRSKSGDEIDERTYCKVIRLYCKRLAEELEKNGIVDLPNEIGSIAAAKLTRRPQYRGKKFVGFGAIDWKTGQYDGELKAFGLVFLPRHTKKNSNLRCFGFVGNRRLFKRVKEIYNDYNCPWRAIDFKDELI